MTEIRLLKFDQIPPIDRGRGIVSRPLMGESTGARGLSSGIVTLPSGVGAPLHTHDVEEQMTVVEGEGVIEMAGRRHPVRPYDTGYAPAGVAHRVVNTGQGGMRILWVYPSIHVTTTIMEEAQTAG